MDYKVNTIAVTGPAGRVVINESDLAEWQANGYKVENEKPNPNGSGDWSEYTDEQLLDLAAQAGIPGTVKKRETLIAKLTEKGFTPGKVNETANGGGNSE